MRLITLLACLCLLCTGLFAQDLNARVQILSPQIQSNNKRTLTVLETTIKDFLNGRKWSADNLKATERIDCNFIITVTQWDGSSNFSAEAQIQSSRPVYGTSYNSTVLNITDVNFDFVYAEGQPLDFSDQNYISNLSSLLGFYAYVITGMDYDTFSKFGGTAYYAKAQTILNNAQNSVNKGWKAFEGLRNRYWLIENLTNKTYSPVRESLYEYHRNGLDVLADNQSKGRKAIIDMLPELQKIDKQKQGSMLNQLFFTSKADELVNVLKLASPQDKLKAYSLLTDIDPANTSKYDALKAAN